MEQNLSFFCEQFLKFYEAGRAMTVVTITDIRGHAPQDVGARMIVDEQGSCFGTVGGGKVERNSIEQAQKMLSEGKNQHLSLTWNLQRDVGMTCGGEVTLFFETICPKANWKIAIFGAGHVSQELTRLLLTLDCSLTVIDPRSEWLEKLPKSDRLKKVEIQEMTDYLPKLDPDTFVAIITMGHPTDYPLAKLALETRAFPYLGVIGSKVKRIKINADLAESGLSEEKIASFFCPMGEPIGKNTPPEIAISIVAQMLKVRDQVFSGGSFSPRKK